MKLHIEDLEKIEILKELSPGCYDYYKKTLTSAGDNNKWLMIP